MRIAEEEAGVLVRCPGPLVYPGQNSGTPPSRLPENYRGCAKRPTQGCEKPARDALQRVEETSPRSVPTLHTVRTGTDPAQILRAGFSHPTPHPIANIDTLRGLSRDGIPAPEGGVYWAPTTIRRILHRRDYIGDCRAHRWVTVRQNGKSTQSERPDEEQIRLPDGVCPPLVDVAIFDTVQARLTRNKAEAARNAREPERFLLRGGFARCGCCGRSLAASFVNGDYPSYNVVSVRTEEHPTGRFRISAEELDAAAWAKVRAILLDPETIRAAVTKHRLSDPTTDDTAAIDRAIATATKQQGNISAAMVMLDDEDARVPLVAQLQALAERKRRLEAEKTGQRALHEDWETTQAGLDLLEGWCDRVAVNIDEMTYQDRRDMLSALGFRALVWPRTRTPRYEFTASIPLLEKDSEVIVGQGS